MDLILNRKIFIIYSIILSLTLIQSCSVSLAPEYDKAIVEKSTSLSSETMTLFAEIYSGTTKDSFEKRENTYNQLIGSFDALSLQAKSRPIPDVSTRKLNELLKQNGIESTTNDYPSAIAFQEISSTLLKMKETDQKTGLNPTLVEAFKGQIEIYLQQAITYETFLKR